MDLCPDVAFVRTNPWLPQKALDVIDVCLKKWKKEIKEVPADDEIATRFNYWLNTAQTHREKYQKAIIIEKCVDAMVHFKQNDPYISLEISHARNDAMGELKNYSVDYIEGKINLAEYKDNCERTLHQALLREPHGFWEHISHVFNRMFNVLDRMISPHMGTGKTMEETYTPGAMLLTGRTHFFTRPTTTLAKEMHAFNDALEQLNNFNQNNRADPSVSDPNGTQLKSSF